MPTTADILIYIHVQSFQNIYTPSDLNIRCSHSNTMYLFPVKTYNETSYQNNFEKNIIARFLTLLNLFYN